MLRICLLIFLINVVWKNKTIFIGCRDYSVILKIKGTGSKKVFSDYLVTKSRPNKILINDEEENSIMTYYDFFDSTKEYSTIKLIWNNIVDDCSEMFNGCSDIIGMDFSNFDTSEVTYMNSMFKGCSSLTSLDLSNFDFSKVTCVEYMFYGCNNLNYIKLEKFSKNVITSAHYTQMFYQVPNNVVVCLNENDDYILNELSDKNCQVMDCSTISSKNDCYLKCSGLYYFDQNNIYHCHSGTECPPNYNKIVSERKQCTNDCSKIPGYPYEFRKKCYKECPADISELKDNSYLCETKCTRENPFEIVEKQECTNFCGINAMATNLCISNYEDESIYANLILNNIHIDILTENFYKTNLNNNQNIIIQESNTKFTITTNKIQKNSNPSLVNLEQCEDILKNYYNIENTDNLIIFIIDVIKGRQKKDNLKFMAMKVVKIN